MSDRLHNAFKRLHRKLTDDEFIYGLVGRQNPSGSPSFDVRGRKNYIYVRLRQSDGSQTVVPARNDARVEKSYGLSVKMRLEGTTYVIKEVAGREDLATLPAAPDSGVPIHEHSALYFQKTEFIDASTGAPDAGKPIKTNVDGEIDASMLDLSGVDVGAIIDAAPEQTTPEAANHFPLTDTGVLKWISWTNILAALGALYEALGAVATHAALTTTHGVTGNIVGTGGAQTLTDKTLTAPVIADFTNAAHDHLDADDGGTLTAAAITDFAETTRDTMGTALVAGANVTITPNDGADTITIAATSAFGGNSMRFTYDSTTTDSDPGSGKIRIGTVSIFDAFFVDDLNAAGGSAVTWMQLMDDSTSENKGYLHLFKESDSSVYRILSLLVVTDDTGYFKLVGTIIATNGSLTNGDSVILSWSRTGDWGDAGLDGGSSFRYQFSTTTTDSDPGAQTMRLNNSTLSSVTQVYLDDTCFQAGNVEDWIQTFDDSTNTTKGFLKISSTTDQTNWLLLRVVSITDGTGYWKVTVTYVDSGGPTFANLDILLVSFTPAGDTPDLATTIAAASTDDTIVDADLWGYVTGGVLVKTAWSNIKATLLTYFSTLFAVLAGTAGGQTLKGGTASGDNLTLMSTNHATKGNINFGTSTYDEVNNRLGIDQGTPLVPLHIGAGSDTPVTSAANVLIYATRAGTSGVVVRDATNNVECVLISFVSGGLFGTQTNHPLLFRSNGVDYGALTPGGLFGFGITSAMDAKVHIVQGTLGDPVLRLQSTATNDDPTEDTLQNRVATTNATVTTLHTFTIPASTTYVIEAHVTARRTGGAAGAAEDGAGYGIVATFKNVAGTATQIGATTALYSHESQAAWDCVFDVTGATARVRVTGAANNDVTWHMTARIRLVSS